MYEQHENIASHVIDIAMGVHKDVGPGLFESVYESPLANRLVKFGLKVDRQLPVGANIDGFVFAEAFRADLFVEDKLIVELKSVEKLAPVHARQTLTYLRLTSQPLGLLINFGGITLKGHFKRILNNYNQPKY
jgi:GxxExxY protein